jgi:hypothetical protein
MRAPAKLIANLVVQQTSPLDQHLSSSSMESNLSSLLDTLDDNIDDLEEVFAPLLKTALGDTVQKLPLLDKAQFYVLITYSIESALFCEWCHVESDSA